MNVRSIVARKILTYSGTAARPTECGQSRRDWRKSRVTIPLGFFVVSQRRGSASRVVRATKALRANGNPFAKLVDGRRNAGGCGCETLWRGLSTLLTDWLRFRCNLCLKQYFLRKGARGIIHLIAERTLDWEPLT